MVEQTDCRVRAINLTLTESTIHTYTDSTGIVDYPYRARASFSYLKMLFFLAKLLFVSGKSTQIFIGPSRPFFLLLDLVELEILSISSLGIQISVRCNFALFLVASPLSQLEIGAFPYPLVMEGPFAFTCVCAFPSGFVSF